MNDLVPRILSSTPIPSKMISPVEKAALVECFQEATRLVPPELRPQFILIGGAGSIFHSSSRWTEDVDIVASPAAIDHFRGAVLDGARNFRIDPFEMIEFDSRQGFPVKMELLELGGSFVESIATSVPFPEGLVASVVDLFLLRAVTVADRGNIRDVEDFKWLLEQVYETGSILPELGRTRLLELLEGVEAAELTFSERLLVAALLSSQDWDNYLSGKKLYY
ncbi:hypothetical protein VF21_10343 [Pseudogymnoascus sp. 05NY08]|nr:hypothetical protein VF21_10343 [Pseudogymnoascus sp. 05NY08]